MAKQKCSAVKGCVNDTLIQSYNLGARRVRICGMHLQRWLRTKKLGPAKAQPIGVKDTPSVRRRTREALERLAEVIGKHGCFFTVVPGQGAYLVEPDARTTVNTLMMHSWAKRGWIKLYAVNERGYADVKVLKAGERALNKATAKV